MKKAGAKEDFKDRTFVLLNKFTPQKIYPKIYLKYCTNSSTSNIVRQTFKSIYSGLSERGKAGGHEPPLFFFQATY